MASSSERPRAGSSIAVAAISCTQVVDDDVAQRADGVVEPAAILDAEILGHRHLDAAHVLAVPHRAEQRVREAEIEELVEAELPEEVVDPEELLLVDHAVQLPRERLGRGEVVPERLLDHDPRAARQPGAAELPRRPTSNSDGGVSR